MDGGTPGIWPLGTRLQARDRVGAWYDGKIVSERGEGDCRDVKVHFEGFSKGQDEWIGAVSDRLLPIGIQTPDTYEVEKIIGKRKRRGVTEYLCVWAASDNEQTWEPLDNISEDLIDDYEAAAAPEKKTYLKEPAEPYVLTQDISIDDSIADELVTEWVEAIGRKGAGLLSHQREEWAAKKFFSMSPCPLWLYRALHRGMRALGVGLEGASQEVNLSRSRGLLHRRTNAPRAWRKCFGGLTLLPLRESNGPAANNFSGAFRRCDA